MQPKAKAAEVPAGGVIHKSQTADNAPNRRLTDSGFVAAPRGPGNTQRAAKKGKLG